MQQEETKDKSGEDGSRIEDGEGEAEVETAVIMGTMAAGRGFGCFAGGPISEAILKLPRLHGKGVWGTKYAWLVIFVGLTMLLGRFGLFGRFGTRAETVELNGKGKGKVRQDGSIEERTRLLET